jgi:hypothetical protein
MVKRNVRIKTRWDFPSIEDYDEYLYRRRRYLDKKAKKGLKDNK